MLDGDRSEKPVARRKLRQMSATGQADLLELSRRVLPQRSDLVAMGAIADVADAHLKRRF